MHITMLTCIKYGVSAASLITIDRKCFLGINNFLSRRIGKFLLPFQQLFLFWKAPGREWVDIVSDDVENYELNND